VERYLKTKENTRMKKLAKVKTSSAKKQKNKRKYEKLSENVKIAKMELHKRLGTCWRGMNLDDPIETAQIYGLSHCYHHYLCLLRK
jgi:hypothetical protein